MWLYLVLETELLQDDRGLEAVRCALRVECDVGLDTHNELLSFVTVDLLIIVLGVESWDIVWVASATDVGSSDCKYGRNSRLYIQILSAQLYLYIFVSLSSHGSLVPFRGTPSF